MTTEDDEVRMLEWEKQYGTPLTGQRLHLVLRRHAFYGSVTVRLIVWMPKCDLCNKSAH
ncbi:hypothetical protein DPMN_103227 [Dreissena polymorpha]|uniref:Uncharacterized protein n=1 Tax=Dreissena polymorpha TaxID=45954 RepID=A0A9D4H9M9_DREPO|nr:hypothetical protein DPMN_103227 [Dreissena polymorpha]